jgi:hypothetical protein
VPSVLRTRPRMGTEGRPGKGSEGMHAISRNRSVVAVVAVVLAGIIVAWLMASAGGDPDRSAAPAAATDTTNDTGSSRGAPEAEDGDTERSGKNDRTGSKDAGSGSSGAGDSGAATSEESGSAEPGSTGGSAGSGGDGSDGTSGGTSGDGTSDDDASTGNDSDGQEPGKATGATVPVEPVQTLAPVPLESVGDFETGLTVQLASMEAVEAEARAPGEISGPALRVTVEAANDADGAVSLDGVVVFLSYGDDRTPASQLGSSSDPLMGDLAPGASRTGTYVFTVPPDQRDDVRVEISYTGSAPTVAFAGSVDG